MKKLQYCLQCYSDLKNEDWEVLILIDSIWVLRCPVCKTVHTYYSDGSIRINGNKAN